MQVIIGVGFEFIDFTVGLIFALWPAAIGAEWVPPFVLIRAVESDRLGRHCGRC